MYKNNAKSQEIVRYDEECKLIMEKKTTNIFLIYSGMSFSKTILKNTQDQFLQHNYLVRRNFQIRIKIRPIVRADNPEDVAYFFAKCGCEFIKDCLTFSIQLGHDSRFSQNVFTKVLDLLQSKRFCILGIACSVINNKTNGVYLYPPQLKQCTPNIHCMLLPIGWQKITKYPRKGISTIVVDDLDNQVKEYLWQLYFIQIRILLLLLLI